MGFASSASECWGVHPTVLQSCKCVHGRKQAQHCMCPNHTVTSAFLGLSSAQGEMPTKTCHWSTTRASASFCALSFSPSGLFVPGLVQRAPLPPPLLPPRRRLVPPPACSAGRPPRTSPLHRSRHCPHRCPHHSRTWRFPGCRPPACSGQHDQLADRSSPSMLSPRATRGCLMGAPHHCLGKRWSPPSRPQFHGHPLHCFCDSPCHRLQQISAGSLGVHTFGRHNPHSLHYLQIGSCAHPALLRRQQRPRPRAGRSPRGRGCAAASPAAHPRPAWLLPPLPGPGAAPLRLRQPPPVHIQGTL